MFHHAHFSPDRNANPGLVFKAAGASVSLVPVIQTQHTSNNAFVC